MAHLLRAPDSPIFACDFLLYFSFSFEVPVDGDGAGGYSVGTLDKPTTRLSQYARGKTGSMNPFTPGGEVKRCKAIAKAIAKAKNKRCGDLQAQFSLG